MGGSITKLVVDNISHYGEGGNIKRVSPLLDGHLQCVMHKRTICPYDDPLFISTVST